MANNDDRSVYAELANPAPNDTANYAELSTPANVQPQIQEQAPQENKYLSFIKSLLPSNNLPLGVNVVSGLMSAGLNPENKNVFEQLPQAAFGQNFGLPQRLASGFGETIPALMSGGLPGQVAVSGAQGYVQNPENPLRGAAINALETVGMGKGLPYLSRLIRPVTKENTAANIQEIHDNLNNQAQKGFNAVSQAVTNRGINQVPLDPSIADEMPNYFPKTRKSQQLINDAQSGDFNALRNLQSDLWQRGTKGMESDLIADRNEAEEMFDLRDRINEAISNHLQNTGNFDLDNLLNQSRGTYKYLKDTFYDKNLPNAIPNLVGEKRKIPKNLMDVLNENSNPMQNLRSELAKGSYAPEQNAIANIPADLSALETRSNLLNSLKNLGIGGGVLTALGAGLGTAYHFLKPSKHVSSEIQAQNQ